MTQFICAADTIWMMTICKSFLYLRISKNGHLFGLQIVQICADFTVYKNNIFWLVNCPFIFAVLCCAGLAKHLCQSHSCTDTVSSNRTVPCCTFTKTNVTGSHLKGILLLLWWILTTSILSAVLQQAVEGGSRSAGVVVVWMCVGMARTCFGRRLQQSH